MRKTNRLREKITQHSVVRRGQTLYQRYRKYIPVISFVGGFLWDSLTLTRIDRMSDNLILLLYLILVGVLMVLVHLIEQGKITRKLILKYQEYYPAGIQFFLGGLFSSYVVFYFHSASLSKDWLFIGLLVVLLVANEFLEKRLTNLFLQMALYALVTLSFFIFFLPVVLHRMGTGIFFLSLLLSIAVMVVLLYLLFHRWKLFPLHQLKQLFGMVGSIYLLMVLFYLLNLIPPVPLSLKFAGIYHHVHREGEQYHLRFAQPEWYQIFKKWENPFYYTQGDTAFCFTAIFAPTRLRTQIQHVWEHYDEEQERWLTTDQLQFEIRGGREGGYRGYTFKRHLHPGKWRVQVITAQGKILGRIRFRIQPAREPISRWKEIVR